MIIQAPICIMKIRNALRYPSQDLGTLCGLGEPWVNKWAKYKPVIYNFVYEKDRPAEWWKGRAGNCGISFKKHERLSNLIQDLKDGVEQFPYEPPRGNYLEPLRGNDFLKYDTNAQPPVFTSNVDGSVYSKSQSYIRFTPLATIVDEDRLTVNDIFGNQLGSVYYGVALESKDQTLWLTSLRPYGNSNTDCEVLFPSLYLREGVTYSVYQFFSRDQVTAVQSNFNKYGTFITVPVGKKVPNVQHISVVTTLVNIALTDIKFYKATKDTPDGKDSISGNIEINNDSGGILRLENNYIQWRYQDSKDFDNFLNGEGEKKLDGNLSIINAPNGFSTRRFEVRAYNMLTNMGEHGGGKVVLFSNRKKQASTYIQEDLNPNA